MILYAGVNGFFVVSETVEAVERKRSARTDSEDPVVGSSGLVTMLTPLFGDGYCAFVKTQ